MKTIVVGGQYGDEGKGKVLSWMSRKDNPQVLARGGVGPNAGHVVKHEGQKYTIRLVPCGSVVNQDARLLIGPGVLVNPEVLLNEVHQLGLQKRIGVDGGATLIEAQHLERDKSAHSGKIGTTQTGCGPAMSDRSARVARRVVDGKEFEELQSYLCDVAAEIDSARSAIIEGSQGFMLSNIHGTYPFVTSKDTTAATVAADVGLSLKSVDRVVMVLKAFTTKVGAGPFPGEISTEEATALGYQDGEFGSVTGRPRRISKDLHYKDLRRAAKINGATDLALTKLDVRFKDAAGAKDIGEVGGEARDFLKEVEHEVGVPVTLIGTGPGSNEIIDRRVGT